MKPKVLSRMALAVAVCAAALAGLASAVQAQGNEQFFPVLVYRTGPYAPNGVPFPNG
jgi:branched-chain amino acid transport system substrate-binding protein